MFLWGQGGEMAHMSSCRGPEFKVSFRTQVGWLTPPCISSSVGMGYPPHIQTHAHNLKKNLFFKKSFHEKQDSSWCDKPWKEKNDKGGLSDRDLLLSPAAFWLGLTPYSFIPDSTSFPVSPVWGVNWRPRPLPRLQILPVPSTTCHFSRGVSENGRGLGEDGSLCWMLLFFTAEMSLRIEIALKKKKKNRKTE